MTTFQVLGPNGQVELEVFPGRPLFIVGRNGTGKSALVHHLYTHGGTGRVIYLPGSRTSLFDSEGSSLTPASRRQLTNNLSSWDSSPDVRWKNISGNARNEKALHDLTAAEVQFKSDLANAIADKHEVEKNTKSLQAKNSPLDRVNVILKQANIAVGMTLADGELKAQSSGREYSYARMSDGERTALILIAEVIAAEDGVAFIIDEPELHLHPSIVVPLIASLLNLRPACEFIVSTHELSLPASTPNARICVLRDVKWTDDGRVAHWDLDVIDNADELPEDLRVDIIGSRRRVLFTEGGDQSLDVPMYSILFPGVSVRPKGGCREVQKAVAGTRSTGDLHHTEGFGLVDSDGMSPTAVAENQAKRVFALPVYSVESLYYDPDVMAAVAARQAETMATDEAEQTARAAAMVADAVAGVIVAGGKAGVAEQLAGRLAERQVRDDLMSKLPGRAELQQAATADVTITTTSPYPAEVRRFRTLRDTNDAHGLIARYAVRSSGMLPAVAKALGFHDRDGYEAAARTRISTDEALRTKLRGKLEPLTSALSA